MPLQQGKPATRKGPVISCAGKMKCTLRISQQMQSHLAVAQDAGDLKFMKGSNNTKQIVAEDRVNKAAFLEDQVSPLKSN